MFAVIVLENESDFPGVRNVYGPFESDEAEIVADKLASRLDPEFGYKLTRGEEIQVVFVEGFNG